MWDQKKDDDGLESAPMECKLAIEIVCILAAKVVTKNEATASSKIRKDILSTETVTYRVPHVNK